MDYRTSGGKTSTGRPVLHRTSDGCSMPTDECSMIFAKQVCRTSDNCRTSGVLGGTGRPVSIGNPTVCFWIWRTGFPDTVGRPTIKKIAGTPKLKQAQLFHTDSDFDDLGLVLKIWKKPRSSHREPPKINQNGGCQIGKGFIIYLGNLFGFGFSLVYRIGVELCIEDVDLSKSITNPFDPLLIVRDPYNSRIIKELHYIAIENPFLSVYVSLVVITPQH